MKAFKWFGIILVVLTVVLSACGGAPAVEPTAVPPAAEPTGESPPTAEPAKAAPTAVPPTAAPPTAVPEPKLSEAEAWAKANGVGPYSPPRRDWAAIEAAANKEGSVVSMPTLPRSKS